MSIWKRAIDLDRLNSELNKSMINHLGIMFISFGDDFLLGEMPVDERTMQPYGILHGGASVVLAETLGSMASEFCLPPDSEQFPVGIEVNANHLKSVSKGTVIGKVSPVRLGGKMHVWNIDIRNEQQELICVSRLTTMIISKR
ncbi:hotdog fold thioesterase [Portibacter marinus]|uniref:hotdog fold thioesterase n=1 Tax=Portibacter marinus TaxID=2898660 RepID=UPI001F17A4ED|nr:hotdog fold thioesterase [Portibacter marinus]